MIEFFIPVEPMLYITTLPRYQKELAEFFTTLNLEETIEVYDGPIELSITSIMARPPNRTPLDRGWQRPAIRNLGVVEAMTKTNYFWLFEEQITKLVLEKRFADIGSQPGTAVTLTYW